MNNTPSETSNDGHGTICTINFENIKEQISDNILDKLTEMPEEIWFEGDLCG